MLLYRWSIAVVVLCALAPFESPAQEFPSKPLRLVVPTTPGGSVDLVARRMGQKVSDQLGQPITVENIAGAGGNIGGAQVARAAPDGHTIMIATVGSMIVSQFLSTSRPYDPIKDFTPIMMAVKSVNYIVAGPSSPVSSLKQAIDYARQNPGKLTYGSAGVGSVFHMEFELIKSTAGIDILHVPYKGVPGSVNGLASGQVHLIAAGLTSIKSLLERVRILAVLDNKRYAGRPDVPAISEVLGEYQALPSWFSYFGPARIPRPIQMRLNTALNESLTNKELRDYFDSIGLIILGGSPEELAESHKLGLHLFGKVVKAAGIKPE
jgi:tripartite-type tricarboxylate transporter receptor subunit TctC